VIVGRGRRLALAAIAALAVIAAAVALARLRSPGAPESDPFDQVPLTGGLPADLVVVEGNPGWESLPEEERARARTPLSDPAREWLARHRAEDRLGESAIPVERERHARIVAGLDVEQPREVEDGARHRSAGRQLRDPGIDQRPVRHAALARPQAVDVVPAGRIAQAAAIVAAVGQRDHARRQGRPRPAAAAARRTGQVVKEHRQLMAVNTRRRDISP